MTGSPGSCFALAISEAKRGERSEQEKGRFTCERCFDSCPFSPEHRSLQKSHSLGTDIADTGGEGCSDGYSVRRAERGERSKQEKGWNDGREIR